MQLFKIKTEIKPKLLRLLISISVTGVLFFIVNSIPQAYPDPGFDKFIEKYWFIYWGIPMIAGSFAFYKLMSSTENDR